MKKQLGMTTVMAATLLGAPACSSSGDDWNDDVYADRDTFVCVDQAGVRADDDLCDDDTYIYGSSYRPYYYGRGAPLPYYGESIYDRRYAGKGSFQARSGAVYDRAPVASRMTRSQAVSRGGLGSSGRSFGGGRS